MFTRMEELFLKLHRILSGIHNTRNLSVVKPLVREPRRNSKKRFYRLLSRNNESVHC